MDSAYECFKKNYSISYTNISVNGLDLETTLFSIILQIAILFELVYLDNILRYITHKVSLEKGNFLICKFARFLKQR